MSDNSKTNSRHNFQNPKMTLKLLLLFWAQTLKNIYEFPKSKKRRNFKWKITEIINSCQFISWQSPTTQHTKDAIHLLNLRLRQFIIYFINKRTLTVGAVCCLFCIFCFCPLAPLIIIITILSFSHINSQVMSEHTLIFLKSTGFLISS